jgi:hypothetical protein
MSFQVWNLDFFQLPGQAVFDRQHQRIAAVSRAPGNLDLFVIGLDNRVWTTFWSDHSGWNADWFPLPGQAVFDDQTQEIAVVSRAPGHLDLFVIGFDNHVWTTFWSDTAGWNRDWFPLPGQAVFDHQYQRVVAVSRLPGNLDLFVIGFDNHVWTTYWNDQAGWNRDWFPLPGQAVFDRQHQHLAAVSRAPGQLDLFVIGFDNRIWTTFWSDVAGWNRDWFPLPGHAVFDHQFQRIAALSRAPGQLDLFVIGFDNRIWTTFWSSTAGWNSDWFQIPEKAVFDRQFQQIATVSRSANHLDLFVIGFDNHVWSTFWGPINPMTLDVTLEQSSHTVPLMVGIHIGATDGRVTETDWSVTKDGVLLPALGGSVPAGVAIYRGIAINDPGQYVYTVHRTGWTDPSGPTTLTKQLNILARVPDPTPPPPVPAQPPTIKVTFSGSIQDAKFHVVGSGFLPNRPATNQGVAIRAVDANILIETRREFAASTATGTIDHVIEGDLSGLTVNAAGIATLAISATDGRPNPADHTDFLWSNTVRTDFHH